MRKNVLSHNMNYIKHLVTHVTHNA